MLRLFVTWVLQYAAHR